MTAQQIITDNCNKHCLLEHLGVINESHMRNVPDGSESHFKVVIVSPEFEGKMLVARHRHVNGMLKEALSDQIHALALHTMTRQE